MTVVGNINSRSFQWLYFTLFVYNLMPFTMCSISINKIITRTPREGDIGLIFDINLINTANEEKELLEYHIHSEKECCINLTETTTSSNAGKIVGGSFGLIEPGEMKTVSVIWPTIDIFNRVGHCDIIISSTNNVKNEEKHFTQQLLFDTRFQQIDPTGTTFKRRTDYHECSNWDMNFLNNCTPVNCESKYFGRRNFYNTTTKMCEPAARCDGENQVYDIYSNECLNFDQLMDPVEIENIKKGNYMRNDTLDFSKTPNAESKRNNDDFLPGLDLYDNDGKKTHLLIEVISGFSLVIATIIIYSSACFCIFLTVNWLSKISASRSSQGKL
ncbi:uncharacterized protein LOC129914280 isoform X1 [Episyrphus balteatus]|uniref:uncharacterized protein LOC129914280 isoform X1 n=1 Tax=Episyrphus balteatus TaxID=286459 RepID=UPI002486423E|nr:uncharacterized protein LOC129914280 isoform X1 [Episyrphus balteatus]